MDYDTRVEIGGQHTLLLVPGKDRSHLIKALFHTCLGNVVRFIRSIAKFRNSKLCLSVVQCLERNYLTHFRRDAWRYAYCSRVKLVPILISKFINKFNSLVGNDLTVGPSIVHIEATEFFWRA